jgi:hypothetical protein
VFPGGQHAGHFLQRAALQGIAGTGHRPCARP